MSNFVNATDATFDAEVLQSDLPVLVDFWADWCGPCKMIGPYVEEAATTYAGKLKVVKVDVQTHQAIAMKYQIRSIPALMIFKGGEVAATQVGAIPKAQLEAFINKNI